MVKEMLLTRGRVAIVDDADYEWLSQWKWSYHKAGHAIRCKRVGGKATQRIMHREILGFPSGIVDHINGDRLDNRRENLRVTDAKGNAWNRGKQISSSQYKGVRPRYGKWLAQIQANGRKVHIGMFETEQEAALAYDSFARTLHGEYARVNFA